MPSQIQVSAFTNIQGKLCERRVALWALIMHHTIQFSENQLCTAADLRWEVHLALNEALIVEHALWTSIWLFGNVKTSILGE